MKKHEEFRSVHRWSVCFLALSVFLQIATFVSAPLNAATVTVSLAELLNRSEKNAAILKESEALRRQAEEKLNQVQMAKWLSDFRMTVLGGLIPDATLTDANNASTFVYNDDKSIGPFVKLNIEAVQPLYTFGKISNYEDMAKKNILLNAFERAKKTNEIRSLVKRAYYTLQLATDSIRILDDVQNRLDEASKKVEELLVKNAENVSETDRLKIRVFSADVKNRRLDARRAQRLSRSALGEVAGLSGEWELDILGLTAERVSDLQKEDVISLALRSKPELNQVIEVIGIKEAEKRAVRADLFPTIFIGGKVEYAVAPGRTDTKNPYFNDPLNGLDFGAAVGLKQDLGFWRTKNKMDQVQAEIDRYAAQREQLLIKTRLDAEKSFEEAVSASEAQKINEDGFRAARSWLTAAGLSFNLGTADTKDVLESFAAYFKAQVDLTKSVYTLNLALSELSLTMGAEILDRLKKSPAVESP